MRTALLIGGTGNISLAVTRLLLKKGWQVTLLNRGNKNHLVPEAECITCDVWNEQATRDALGDRRFDVVAQFIAYQPEEIARDVRLYAGRCLQYIFVSTASAYAKPPRMPLITEGTPLFNPYWQYSRDKIACEQVLQNARVRDNFPFTIVRPSHTYGYGALPLPIHGGRGPWQTIQRIKQRKPVLIPGDGTSLWTVTWSEDFARGFVGLMGNDRAIGESVHITSDEALTWNQIHWMLAEALDAPFLPCYVPSTMLAQAQSYDYTGSLLGDKSTCALFDNSKIRRLVPGFHCPTTFDAGLRLSLAHLESQPDRQMEDPAFDSFCDRVIEIIRQAEQQIAQL